jgi:hypothetical protein
VSTDALRRRYVGLSFSFGYVALAGAWLEQATSCL